MRINMKLLNQDDFWSLCAKTKDFKDPFYLEELRPYINKDSFIIEYGCGYGRILNMLHHHGYNNIAGFDFSEGMIKRGHHEFPYLDLTLIDHATIPLQNQSVDTAILSTVLCCIPDDAAQQQIIDEISRVLKPNSILYLTDFLITDTEHMMNKYNLGTDLYNTFGIYQTSEGALVRHHSQDYISKLLKNFQQGWYREENFVTMNNNPVKSFHGIYKSK